MLMVIYCTAETTGAAKSAFLLEEEQDSAHPEQCDTNWLSMMNKSHTRLPQARYQGCFQTTDPIFRFISDRISAAIACLSVGNLAARSPPPSISSFLIRRCAWRLARAACVSLALISCVCFPSLPLKSADLVGFLLFFFFFSYCSES
uniref:(northern house mosquito) hypothetical protein n=1 Tax=Culex pipiens TaxID=7175 RepID=A0A8D8FNL8_CULPI